MANETTSYGGEPLKADSPPVGESGSVYAVPGESGEGFATQTGFVGYALHDPLGRKIGKVEKIFVHGRGEPEYVAVKIASLWRKKSLLIPVQSASLDDGRRALVLQ